MRQEDEADGPQDTGKAQEPEGSAEKAGSKKGKYQKAQAKADLNTLGLGSTLTQEHISLRQNHMQNQ